MLAEKKKKNPKDLCLKTQIWIHLIFLKTGRAHPPCLSWDRHVKKGGVSLQRVYTLVQSLVVISKPHLVPWLVNLEWLLQSKHEGTWLTSPLDCSQPYMRHLQPEHLVLWLERGNRPLTWGTIVYCNVSVNMCVHVSYFVKSEKCSFSFFQINFGKRVCLVCMPAAPGYTTMLVSGAGVIWSPRLGEYRSSYTDVWYWVFETPSPGYSPGMTFLVLVSHYCWYLFFVNDNQDKAFHLFYNPSACLYTVNNSCSCWPDLSLYCQ